MVPAARKARLEDGWYGIRGRIGRTLGGPASDAGRTALDELVAFLAHRSHRLNDGHRLACGDPTGERRKQTGGRCTVPNADRMAELCGLTDSGPWADYWLAA